MNREELIRMAREALDALWQPADSIYQRAADALDRALAQPEQKPVAWRWSTPRLRGLTWHYTNNRTFAESQPLYTQPPQRKPLTEEQIAEICMDCSLVTPCDIYFARAIERAHGIGDNT